LLLEKYGRQSSEAENNKQIIENERVRDKIN
jgi:hypothetical protein